MAITLRTLWRRAARMLRGEERDGEITAGNCEYYSGSFAECLPKRRVHADARLSVNVTPTTVTVWNNNRKWLVFTRAKGEKFYCNRYEGILQDTPTGLSWGKPVVLGSHRGFLDLPKDRIASIHMALAR